MKNNTQKFLKAGIAMCIAVLFVGTSAAAIGNMPETLSLVSTKKTATLFGPLRDETELKYYMEEGLSNVIGIGGGTGPYVWKSAVRFTPDEMSAYTDWTITDVNVAFSMDNGLTLPMDIRIYIYDKGTATRPGDIIVNDTTAVLDTTGITMVPLVTPVDLAGHEELWVAIEWTQYEDSGVFYAWMDTLTGPAVDGKGDWIYLNSGWSETQTFGANFDGNWGIGAIIEGAGLAQLSIGNIKGPIGIKADLSNIGTNVANNVEWSISVTGGILGMINKTATGTIATLNAGATTPMSVGMILGFGKISIVITADAQNANAVSTTKSAFVLGPLVIGIK
jgi:hypothetical protein